MPETLNFAYMEEDVLSFWGGIDAFKECLKQSKNKPRFSFYDGPPFATGLPHYGHILAGTIKDIVTRYAHQNGFHVERRFGWDCHGLPVEYEVIYDLLLLTSRVCILVPISCVIILQVDKALGIKGPEDVQKMGIKAYNDECRKIVMRYSTEWGNIVTRLGRWIGMFLFMLACFQSRISRLNSSYNL